MNAIRCIETEEEEEEEDYEEETEEAEKQFAMHVIWTRVGTFSFSLSSFLLAFIVWSWLLLALTATSTTLNNRLYNWV